MSPRLFRFLADAIVIIHAGFVLFVAFGGLLVLRWRRLAWVHLPSVVWGAAVEFGNWVCPLTPLEDLLRERGGMAVYTGDFIAQHVVPLLYPAHLTRAFQLLLGGAALAVNAVVYWRLAARRTRN